MKGQNIPKPGVPESFKVLIKELQSLGLDIKVLDKNNEEIDLKQDFDDEDDGYIQSGDSFDEPTVAEEGEMDGYTMENPDDEDDLYSVGSDDGLDDLFGDGIDDGDETM